VVYLAINLFGHKISFSTSASRYGYSNARVYGMMGLLLTKADMEDLIRVKTIAGMFELLQRTAYKEDMTRLESDDPTAIEAGTVKHFSRIIRKIISFTPKDDLPALKALIKRWVFLNLNIILNAKRSGVPFSSIRDHLFDLPELRIVDAQRLYEMSLDSFVLCLVERLDRVYVVRDRNDWLCRIFF